MIPLFCLRVQTNHHVTDKQTDDPQLKPTRVARVPMLVQTTDYCDWRFYLLTATQPPPVDHHTAHSSSRLSTRRCPVIMAGLPLRRPPYKDFLQPALQRRFASTATVLLTVSYIEAVLLTRWDSRESAYSDNKQPVPLLTMPAFSPLVMVPYRSGRLPNSHHLHVRPRHPRPAHRPIPRRPANHRLRHPDPRRQPLQALDV